MATCANAWEFQIEGLKLMVKKLEIDTFFSAVIGYEIWFALSIAFFHAFMQI